MLFRSRSERELLALDLIEQLSPPRQPDGRTSLEVVQERLPRFLQEGSGSFDFVHRRFHSGELWTARVQMFQSSHHQDNGLNFAVITDVSAERSAEQRLRQLAMQDQRSLLPNRLALLEWWQQRSTEQPDQRWLVLNLDLDDFRAVNEVLGVPAADALLVAIAADLQAVLEEERQAGRQGAFLAHLESDEFVLLIAAEQGSAAGFPADMIERWSAQLRELVHRCAARESPAVASLSFCLGCAWVRADPEAPEQVLQKANIALLHAKREGPGSTTIYNQQMAGGIQERLDLQAALQRALDQAPAPAGLELVYQPQIDGQGRLLGAEALLRFRTEQGRAVPPDQLVRLAERTGQIRQLGLQVLRRVCQQLVQWRGLEVGVIAINVSARQLERQPGQATFLNHALAMLQAYDLQPQQFCLEVTETALLGSDQALLSELQALRGAGFGLSLDDFGTGYSAMAILRDYPLSEFKIDRSFVQDLRQRSDSQAILACMAQLADRLGLDCVVEGVESEEQWLLLQRFGLSRFQGYWCSPPLDPEAFEAFVRTHGRPASELTP